ncbi:MAG: ABC transporter ATP-binding protein [Eubacteriales bacterium]|nr:ABC transporter ATP-binding protein [Eubacteriales bacterium]
MIELSHVHFRYAEMESESLKGISLKLARGKCLVLSGSSGSGKTTVTRLINGLIPHFYPGELSGSIKIKGEDIRGRQAHELAMQIASVFQNPRTQFFNTDTDSELVFAMENCAIPSEEMQLRYGRTVADLHLEHLSGRDIFSLSGGEKQWIAFGSDHALEPELFVLDEPSANLDHVSIERLREILLHLKQKGKTILIAEHRLYYLRDIADQLAWLEDGRLETLFDISELRSKSCEELHALGLRTLAAPISFRMPVSCPTQTPALELRALTVSRGKQRILTELNLLADYGQIVGVTGANGSGKSTLAKTICGLMTEENGSIYFDGQILPPRARKDVAFLVMQDPNYQLFGDSVENELRLSAYRDPPDENRIEDLLTQLDLNKLRTRHPLSLSGGQKQRLCIALAALSPASVLIFDEPSSGLDFDNMRRITELLKALSKQQRAILVISHDQEFLQMVCTQIVSLHEKQ